MRQEMNAFRLEDDGTVLEAVGEASYQEPLVRITGSLAWEDVRCEVLAALVPEPDNAFDENAIAVQVNAETVGYLSRGDAIDYQPLVGELAAHGMVATCEAMICGRSVERGGTTKNLGIFLHLPSSDDCLDAIEEGDLR